MTTVAVVLAAGRGTRVGGDIPKQLRVVAGHPVVWHAVRAFHDHPAVDLIWLVGAPDQRDRLRAATAGLVDRWVDGGDSRTASVAAAVEQLGPDVDRVLVHDAARPAVPAMVIGRVLDALASADAVATVVPVNDTIVLVEGGRIVASPDRDTVFAHQTPQGFRRAILQQAHAVDDDGRAFTDDVSRVSGLIGGARVAVVAGDPRLHKVTHEHDLVLVGHLLGADSAS
ncbi:MAG: hypothetical protein JWR27_494 [Aeromicrobium sp.]|jgi:2-C-methyl-D-erythritol 4-phosphate cytidylyltransferase/2-C-methyl-D-erythritol 2,4-cyclodiphosphate synthase|nr:hypothetical protein [Aeromicrobium sp.]